MESRDEIKDKTKRLVYYLITQKNHKETPIQILKDLFEMTENDLNILSEKKVILSELITEELETNELQKLINHFRT